jgi:protein-tyrosine phosphatase
MDITPLYSRILLGSAPATGAEAARIGVDVLVLCAKEYQPRQAEFPGIKLVLHAPMSDDGDPDNFDVAMAAAESVVREWRRGRTILITCLLGRNRSALVATLALFFLTGIPVRDLVDHLRSLRRDPMGGTPLTNPAFIDFLASIGYTRAG